MKFKLKQKGQAMSEAMVTMVYVGVPIAILLPALSALFDVQNSVHQSSRYITWERVVGRNDGDSGLDMRSEVQERFYKNPLNGLSNNVDQVNPLWNAASGDFSDDGALVRYEGTDAVSSSDDQLNRVAAWDSGDRPEGWAGMTRQLKLAQSGINYVDVSLDLETDNRLDLSAGKKIRSMGAILTDNWVASNEEQFSGRVSGLAPFDGETIVDYIPALGEVPVIGAILDDIEAMEAAETMTLLKDIPVFDVLFPELDDAALGDFDMAPEGLSQILPD